MVRMAARRRSKPACWGQSWGQKLHQPEKPIPWNELQEMNGGEGGIQTSPFPSPSNPLIRKLLRVASESLCTTMVYHAEGTKDGRNGTVWSPSSMIIALG